ncbi:hypothetical protein QYF61_018249 [Mycteria americana]|uniref:Uncharacterized protein n=1 Tax=Mycteria americana TaxID=33587 RepID=A0AAN7RUU4_MYCAM|nr:hypothetical protein QYF61_018249 [Mycteria americana]
MSPGSASQSATETPAAEGRAERCRATRGPPAPGRRSEAAGGHSGATGPQRPRPRHPTPPQAAARRPTAHARCDLPRVRASRVPGPPGGACAARPAAVLLPRPLRPDPSAAMRRAQRPAQRRVSRAAAAEGRGL